MNASRLKEEQLRLSKKVILKDEFLDINYIAGCDIAYTSDQLVAVVVVLDYKTLEFVEARHVVAKPQMPYIPTFLSYRESPPIIEAFNLLDKRPDIMVVDGNGILHPRKLGLASHLGLLLDIPTIGIAKKQLCGELKNGKVYVDDEQRAIILETKYHAKPIFVSPGHKVNMKSSMQIVQHCMKEGNKLPEPTRIAHKIAVKEKAKLKQVL